MQRNGNVLLYKKTRHTYIKKCLKVHKMPRPTKLCGITALSKPLQLSIVPVENTSISRFADTDTQYRLKYSAKTMLHSVQNSTH